MIIEKRFNRTFMCTQYRDDRFPEAGWCTAERLVMLMEQRDREEEKKAGTLPEGEWASWYITYTAQTVDGRPSTGGHNLFMSDDLPPDWEGLQHWKKMICGYQAKQRNPLLIETMIITGFFRMRNVPAQKQEQDNV